MMQVEDITERREAELQLANRALHDGLTGLPNRFLTRQWLASALEDHPGQGVGVLYCDLDRFKVVNDSLGHGAGDSLLAQVAERLRAAAAPRGPGRPGRRRRVRHRHRGRRAPAETRRRSPAGWPTRSTSPSTSAVTGTR